MTLNLALHAGLIEVIGDAAFLLDILIHFRTAYWSSRGRLVMSRPLIAWQYATTWLWVDLLASMPWDSVFSIYHPSNLLNFVKIARLSRLIRMVKVVRLRQQFGSPSFLSSIEVQLGPACCSLLLGIRSCRVMRSFVLITLLTDGRGILAPQTCACGARSSRRLCSCMRWRASFTT